MMTTDPRPLGLYLHIPFCPKKCAYCDFYSQSDYSLSDRYLDALITEMKLRAKELGKRSVDTVYIGGGTPSSLSAEQLERLLSSIHALFTLQPDAEITLEANPATLDVQKLHVLQEKGATRLSIGLQSANNTELQTLSRIHSFEEFASTYRLARQYIPNISLDLMYGLPGQTQESFQASLKEAVQLAPEHISLYALKIEEGTPFAAMGESLDLPSDDTVADFYLFACEYLTKHQYLQYEISNFARQGCFSRHNIRYWKREEYLGLGPSAHSFLSGERFANQRDIHAYTTALLQGDYPPLSEETLLTPEEALDEEIMLTLRLSEGLDLAHVKAVFGYDIEKSAASKIALYLEHGFMKRDGNRLSLTPRGFLVSNSLIAELLPD